MKVRKPLVAVSAALLVALVGCSNDDSTSDSADTTSATAASATETGAAESGGTEHESDHAEAADAPTADDLKATLVLLADPAQPVDAKQAVVVEGDQRQPNIEAMTAATANYQVGFDVTNVQVDGTTATADVAIQSPHGTAAPTPWTWENVDGTWKLSDASTCALLGMARAAC
ncbi:hypothetical protein [Rhodococcus sp. HNM0569]|uniref:hypothetical protein n=1 Tax=Rhodococcus sp. HNM0569 TaxID=2716340 RepID=UPI00146C2A40|nr:hypothetical protein [Rhodococcus sp. HNM0569]